jgi:transcriptional regulator with XRE-family HTH domain
MLAAVSDEGFVPGTKYAKAVGARIAEARKRKGMTQKQLAAALEMSPRTITEWEQGRTNPYRQIVRLASSLEVPPSWIWHGAEQPGEDGREDDPLTRIEQRLDDLAWAVISLTNKIESKLAK